MRVDGLLCGEPVPLSFTCQRVRERALSIVDHVWHSNFFGVVSFVTVCAKFVFAYGASSYIQYASKQPATLRDWSHTPTTAQGSKPQNCACGMIAQ